MSDICEHGWYAIACPACEWRVSVGNGLARQTVTVKPVRRPVMSELTKDQVWDQIESLRAKYASSILEDQAIIVAARERIAKNRQLADELPVAKRRKKAHPPVSVESMTKVLTALGASLKAEDDLPVRLTVPMQEAVITGVDHGAEDISAAVITDNHGNVVAQARQTMLIRDDV